MPTIRSLNWEADRGKYAWHLTSPYDKQFDRDNWWNNVSDPTSIAAVYELARRHPDVGKAHKERKRRPSKSIDIQRPALDCLLRIGFKPWSKLSPDEKEFWLSTMGNIKGVEGRVELELCACLNDKAHMEVVIPFLMKHSEKSHLDDIVRAAVIDFSTDSKRKQKVDEALAKLAVQSHRRGNVLIEISPDLPLEKAAKLLERAYGDHLKKWKRSVNARPTKWRKWLPLISQFEKDQNNLAVKLKSDVFNRYRRAIDDLHFAKEKP